MTGGWRFLLFQGSSRNGAVIGPNVAMFAEFLTVEQARALSSGRHRLADQVPPALQSLPVHSTCVTERGLQDRV